MDPQPFTPEQQTSWLKLIARGASPASACESLGLTLEALHHTLTCDAEFRRRRDTMQQVLSQNVATRLYHAAMEGSVPAQTVYLRGCPPPEWREPNNIALPVDDLSQLSDDELRKLLDEEGMVAATPSAAGVEPPAGAAESADVPPAAEAERG